jgi:hypothetical protein
MDREMQVTQNERGMHVTDDEQRRSTAEAAQGTADDWARWAREKAGAAGERLYQQGARLSEYATENVKAYPATALFVAGVVGYGIAYLIRGGNQPSRERYDLGTFVPRGDVDPFYLSTPHFMYPDGPVAIEPYRVTSAAMSEAGMAGLGRLTLSRRERMVLVEPRGSGLSPVTLRSTEEVRAADFRQCDDELDEEAVAIAAMIIKRKSGTFDPSIFRDRYQDALRELMEANARPAGQGTS